MGRLRTAALECKYKEVDWQLKEQLIHGLNDDEILTDVMKELTKYEENVIMPSEMVLVWAKRIEAQRAQTVAISSLHESKMLMQLHIKKIGPATKNMQISQSQEKDTSTADKSIN